METTPCYSAGAGVSTRPTVRSLYVHVPFCHTICGYCDFYSEIFDKKAVGPLVDCLLVELETATKSVTLQAETLFVGGGTPTTLPTADLARLLLGIRRHAAPRPTAEFTVEANPATVTPEVAETLAGGGVNRISIGAQSFDPAELRVLDRIHRPEQVAETIRVARAAGIHRISIDLIFAVPGQSLESWERNLRSAIDLGTDHLSCYGLTFEPGTPLFDQLRSGRVRQVENELEAEMFEVTIRTLESAGFHQYEISNFARPGCECRHNLGYWRHEHYLGIGPSACGFLPDSAALAAGGPDNVQPALRYKNVPDTAAYVRALAGGRSPRIESESLNAADQARDAAWLELRLNAGIDRARFQRRYGHDPARLFAMAIEKHISTGLLEQSDSHIRLTAAGRLLANVIAQDLI